MTTEDNFACVFCSEKFDNKAALKEHFRHHADPTQPLLMQNKSKIKTEGRLISEINDDEKDLIKCDVCPEVFSVVAKALTHIHRAHPEYDVKHFCSWCGQFFTLKQLYQKHLLTHENEIKPERDEIIHCDKCDVTFFHAAALNYHNKFFHRESAELPNVGYSKKVKLFQKELLPLFYCPFCGEEHNNKINLHKHLEDYHDTEYRTQTSVCRCPLCEAIFYQMPAYETHLTFHSHDDVYVWSDESRRELPNVFTLMTVPPIEETIKDFGDDSMDAIGVENLLQLSMELNEGDNEDDPPVIVKKRKKHKKHKKSKKAAITLDEFLNMNSDVFGEDIDFQGVEEVPSRIVAKQLRKVKPALGTVKRGDLAPTTLQKLKQQGIVVKKKGTNVRVLPKNMSLGKIKSADVNTPAETSKLMLAKLIKQGTHLKVTKTQTKDNSNETSNNPIDKIEQNTSISEAITCPKTKLLANSQLTVKSSNDSLKMLAVKPEEATDSDNDEDERTDQNTPIDNKTNGTTSVDKREEIEKLKSNQEKNIIALPFYPLPESFSQQINPENKYDSSDKIRLLNNDQITVKSISPDNMKHKPSTSNKNDNESNVSSNEAEKDDIDANESDGDSEKQIKHLKGLNSCLTIKTVNKKNIATNDNSNDNDSDHNEAEDVNDPKTKLLSNPQLTLKSPTGQTKKIEDKDEVHGFDNNEVEIPHKIKGVNCPKAKLLSNAQLTIKSTSDNQTKKVEDNGEFHNDNDVPQIAQIIKSMNSPKIKLLSNSQLTIKSSSDNQTKEVDDDDDECSDSDVPLVAIKGVNCPKTKLLSNSQLTIKSSDNQTKEVEGNNDDEYSDSDVPQVAIKNVNCLKTKILSNTQLTIKSSSDNQTKEVEGDDDDECSDVDVPQVAIKGMNCPIPKILSNTQLTIKSSSDNQTKEVEGNDDDDECSDVDVPQVAIKGANCPKTKILSNSQLTIKSSSDNQTKKIEDDDDECSDSDVPQVAIKSVNSPKTKLLSNSQLTIKSSSNNQTKKSLNNDNFGDPQTSNKVDQVTKREVNYPKSKLLSNSQLTVKSSCDNQTKITAPKTEQDEWSSDEWENDNLEEIQRKMKPIKILPQSTVQSKHPDFGHHSDCDDDVLYPINIKQNLGINHPKSKLLKNAQLTIKNLMNSSNSLCVQKPDTRCMEIDTSAEINNELSMFKQENKTLRVVKSGSKIINNSKITKSFSNFKQSNVTIKSSSRNLVSNEKEWSSNDEDDHVSNTAQCSKVEEISKQEASVSSTNKLFSNTQLTVKAPIKRQMENKSVKNVKMCRQNVNSSREYRSISQSSNNQITNTMKVRAIKGTTIKQEMNSPQAKVTDECDDPIDLISSDDDQANTPTTSENNLSKLQNKLGLGITLKSVNNVSSSDNKVDDEGDIERESESEIDSTEEKINKHESVVNKLKATNLGLSVKSVRNNNVESTQPANEATGADDTLTEEIDEKLPINKSQSKNTQLSNFLSNNKNITLKPPQKPQPERCVSPDSSQVQFNKPKGKILKMNINKAQEIASTSKSEVVSETVTVKQVQTKTVIQEITTVTKTIRTVNQTEAVSSESTNSFARGGQRVIRPNTIQKIQRPIVQMGNQRPRLRPESSTHKPGTATSTIVRAPAPATIRPMKAIQAKPSTPTRQPAKRITPSSSSPNTAKPLKISPNVSAVGTKRPVAEEAPGPFSCFKKQKESYFHGEDLEDLIEKHTATASSNVSSMSQVSKQNFSCASKVVNSSFQSKSAHMKSEFSASCSQQVNKVSTSTKVQSATTQPTNTTSNNSLLKKLKQQGLLVKKPTLDIQFSDASNDANMDVDSDN